MVLRWMVFVDGQYLVSEKVVKALKADLTKDPLPGGLKGVPYYSAGEYLWMPPYNPGSPIETVGDVAPKAWIRFGHLFPEAVRSFYYASASRPERIQDVRSYLRMLNFSPEVFVKPEGSRRSKGVDIKLTTDMLTHAYQGNYDVAVLVSGDPDYIPVIREVMQTGKRVAVVALEACEKGKALEMRLVPDSFQDVSVSFRRAWQVNRSYAER